MSDASPSAFLTIPGSCDLACVFCVSYRREAPPRDPQQDRLELLAEIDRQVEAGVTRIIWGNGDHEPATFPDLEEVVRYARDRGVVHQSLVTNGYQLGTPGALKTLAGAGLNQLRLALFEWDEASADLFCDGEGVAAHKRALLAACREHGVEVELSVLLMRCNYQRVGEILDLYSDVLPEGTPPSIMAIWTTQGQLNPVFLPPYTGLYERVVEAALARPDRKLHLNNHPDCLRRGLPAPPPNLILGWVPTGETFERCPDCPGGEACGGLPPDYDGIHRDRLEPSLSPLHAPLELEELTTVLRDPPNDPLAAVAKILGLPPPPPFVETDPVKLSQDPTSAFYGLKPEEVEAGLAAEQRRAEMSRRFGGWIRRLFLGRGAQGKR